MSAIKEHHHDQIESGMRQGKKPKQEKDSLDFAVEGIIVILLVCFILFIVAVIRH